MSFEDRPTIKDILDSAKACGQHTLTPSEGRLICAAYRIEVCPEDIAESAEHARWLASTIGFPVVMAIVSPDITDQEEAGGIITGINGPCRASRAFNKIVENVKNHKPYADVIGVQIRRMIKDSQTFMIHAIRDDNGGKLIAVSMHNASADYFQDIAFRAVPGTREEAMSMISEIRAAETPAKNEDQYRRGDEALAELIIAVSQMTSDIPDIAEIDLNPVFVSEEKTIVSGVRIGIQSRSLHSKHAAVTA